MLSGVYRLVQDARDERGFTIEPIEYVMIPHRQASQALSELGSRHADEREIGDPVQAFVSVLR